MLRFLGCKLPIQVWHLGVQELDRTMRRILGRLDVQCVDMKHLPNGRASTADQGCELKLGAIINCPFEEVLFLDADNLPVRDPSFLFDSDQYRTHGAVFWPNVSSITQKHSVWRVFEVPYDDLPGLETGQLLVNKNSNWEPLRLAEELSLRKKLFDRLQLDNEDLLQFAWRKLGRSYAMPVFPPQILTVPDFSSDSMDAMLCQHDFFGERLFQHRLFYKWDLLGENPWIAGAFFEPKCREFLAELRKKWNGRRAPRNPKPISSRASLHKDHLLKNIWLLELPPLQEEPRNTSNGEGAEHELPEFVRSPQKIGDVNLDGENWKPKSKVRSKEDYGLWTEVRFAPDGTISRGASSQTGYFWDIGTESEHVQLTLSTDYGPTINFRKLGKGAWRGKWLAGSFAGKRADLRAIHDVYPNLLVASKPAEFQSKSSDIRRAFGARASVNCSAPDLGDHILAACACAGLSRLGVQLTIKTRYAKWLSRIAQPCLTVTHRPAKGCIDVHHNYGHQLRYAISRASWYASALHPALRPARPAVDLTGVNRRFPFDKYVLLAPYSDLKIQEWPEVHWTRLANLLREEGYEVVAIGGEDHAGGLRKTFGPTQTYWSVGNEPEWVMDALIGSTAYIGIDNSMTQLAALLQVRCIAIHSQFLSSFLWPYGDVHSVSSKTECTYCKWQDDKGYLASCNEGCSALATIRPESVVRTLRRAIQGSSSPLGEMI